MAPGNADGVSGQTPARGEGDRGDDARGEGDRGDVDVRATEVLSMGMEWMWLDPVGFAAADPDYFDFVWDTVVGGIP